MALQQNDIGYRLKNGLPVSDTEKVAFMKSNPGALAAFMIDNNPGNVNQTLRKLGFNHLGFVPHSPALVRQMQMFIDKEDSGKYQEVLNNFNLKTEGLSNEFLSSFHKTFGI